MRFNVSEINECLRTRKSIYPKYFSDRKVSKELIEVIIENARWAPTHKLTQPWRFKVFYEKGIKTFIKFHEDLNSFPNTDVKLSETTQNKIVENADLSSAIIGIILHNTNQNIKKEEEISALAMAVQNIYITCSAYGLGGFWFTGGITYSQIAKKLLNLEKNEECYGFFYLGYPKEKWPDKTYRIERRKILSWIEK